MCVMVAYDLHNLPTSKALRSTINSLRFALDAWLLVRLSVALGALAL